MYQRRRSRDIHLRSRRSARAQRGQALILAVVCLLVLVGALFVVFDTGQATGKKVQLTNAADAAAYSVGIEQARALNTVAYLNRAEVANQVAIAQLISIQSYANYADSLIGRTSNVLYALGLALNVWGGEFLITAAETMRGIQDGFGGYVIGQDQVLGAIVTGLDKLNTSCSALQTTAIDGLSISGLVVASKVVQDNTADTGGSHAEISAPGQTLLAAQLTCFASHSCPSLAAAVTANDGYTERYTIPDNSGDPYSHSRNWAGDRDANVMMAARDGFTAARNAGISITPAPFLRIKGTKLGGTDLVDYNRWVAVDDLTVSIKAGPCFLFGLCIKWKGLTFGLSGAATKLPGFTGLDSTPVFSPGISLTPGSGPAPSNYVPGTGSGWYSPYSRTWSLPYQGALGNVAWGADVAAHPADVGNDDFVADLSYLMGYDNPVPPEVNTDNVVWVGTTHGLRDYNDVAPGKAVGPYTTSNSDSSDVGPIFTVYVQQPDGTVRTGANIGMEGGDLKLQNQGAGGAISAVSSAQVYYDRPSNLSFMRRADGQRELGNLFEPYWQVRLVPTPTSLKAFLDLTTVAGL